MDRSYAEQRQLIVAKIARDRLTLQHAIDGLSSRVGHWRRDAMHQVQRASERLDVRRRIRAAPYRWLAASAAVGFLLGRRR